MKTKSIKFNSIKCNYKAKIVKIIKTSSLIYRHCFQFTYINLNSETIRNRVCSHSKKVSSHAEGLCNSCNIAGYKEVGIINI